MSSGCFQFLRSKASKIRFASRSRRSTGGAVTGSPKESKEAPNPVTTSEQAASSTEVQTIVDPNRGDDTSTNIDTTTNTAAAAAADTAGDKTAMEKVAHSKPNLSAVTVDLAAGGDTSTPEAEEASHDESMILRLARQFNCFFLDRYRVSSCKPLIVEGYQIGLITPEVLSKLRDYPDVFVCQEDSVRLASHLNSYESRSRAIDTILRKFREEETFVTLKGWRDECYEVRVDLNAVSLMRMERSATCLFGIRQFGVDINGYVNHPELGLCLWLQKRSKTKQRWPGKMDNIVGGGLSVGYSVIETAYKESGEEAGIPHDILQRLQPIGTVSIFYESERGLSPNTEYVYDLELPLDFVPANQDGEVSEFHLYPVMEAFKVIMSPDFKTTSCPVALDFLIRHEVITPENEPDIDTINDLLHIPLTDFYRQIEGEDSDEHAEDDLPNCS